MKDYKGEMVQAGLRLPGELNEWCTRQAQELGLTRNAWVVSLIWRERERIEGAMMGTAPDARGARFAREC